MKSKLAVSVIGGTTYDRVLLPGGGESRSFGGITYNLMALSYLFGGSARIRALTRVGRERAATLDTHLLGQHDGGHDDPLFLIAELTVFAGVWIESGYGNFGIADAEVFLQGGV